MQQKNLISISQNMPSRYTQTNMLAGNLSAKQKFDLVLPAYKSPILNIHQCILGYGYYTKERYILYDPGFHKCYFCKNLNF